MGLCAEHRSLDESTRRAPSLGTQKCINTARKLKEIKKYDYTKSKTCMACDPTRDWCPHGCQDIVDKLYVQCDGVAMPDGWYFDPDEQLTGEWNEETRGEVKKLVERCGCNAGVRGAGLGAPQPSGRRGLLGAEESDLQILDVK